MINPAEHGTHMVLPKYGGGYAVRSSCFYFEGAQRNGIKVASGSQAKKTFTRGRVFFLMSQM